MVRVIDDSDPTRSRARQSLKTIIARSEYLTRNEEPPRMPAGTRIVAMGGHGGHGMFVAGVVAGERRPFDARLRPSTAF